MPTPTPTAHVARLSRSLAVSAAAAGVAVGSAATRVAVLRHRRPDPGVAHRGIATHDGVRLHARVHGDDDAPATVVLAHGWTMTSAFWSATAEALARKGLRVVTYDQRGHGRSSLPARGAFDLAHLGRDLDAVLDATVPAGMPTMLVGHSMGAMGVLAWAGGQHDRRDVVGTVLLNTALHGVVPDAIAAITGRDGGAARALLQQAIRVPAPIPDTPLIRPIVRHVALGESPPPGAVALTQRLFASCPPAVRVGFGQEITRLDLRRCAAQLDLPTLVVAGTHDRLTPAGQAQALVAALPAAELQVLAGAGHQVPLERPAETLSLVERHLRDVTGQRPAHIATPPPMGEGVEVSVPA